MSLNMQYVRRSSTSALLNRHGRKITSDKSRMDIKKTTCVNNEIHKDVSQQCQNNRKSLLCPFSTYLLVKLGLLNHYQPDRTYVSAIRLCHERSLQSSCCAVFKLAHWQFELF